MIGPYGATKAALNRYTEALAAEVASDGIFVNAMAPVSIVDTALSHRPPARIVARRRLHDRATNAL